jgi:hypothetical protein
VKRLASLVAAVAAAAAISVVALAGGASAANSLPTLSITTNGKALTATSTIESGAANVAIAESKPQGSVALVRLNPGVPFSVFAQAVKTINQHHGDINYLNPYGALIFDANVGKGTSTFQTTLEPGNYFALDVSGNGTPPHAEFIVTQAAAPAALPKPAATVSAIEFGFKAPKTLHDGQVVRFENDGFVVHMIQPLGVKNAASGRMLVAGLKSGSRKVQKLVTSQPAWGAGPMSSGGMLQGTLNAKPGYYVLACFMATQDGRPHTLLGMEQLIKVVK